MSTKQTYSHSFSEERGRQGQVLVSSRRRVQCTGQLPYLKSWYNDPGIAVGHAGTEFDDLAARLLTSLDIHPKPALTTKATMRITLLSQMWHTWADVARVRRRWLSVKRFS